MTLEQKLYECIQNDQFGTFQSLLSNANSISAPPLRLAVKGKSGSSNKDVALKWHPNELIRGETLLHLTCRLNRIGMVQLLLDHPALDVNVMEETHQWTALHRALYHGHIYIALLLLAKTETSLVSIDRYGLTPFQLFKTVHAKCIPSTETYRTELFTWGSNQHCVLGYPTKTESCERLHRVSFRPQDHLSFTHPIYAGVSEILDVGLSEMHAVLVTSVGVYVWGLGGTGRLGLQHQGPQTTPTALPLAPSHRICAVAVGRDHTLLLTDQHRVLGFGSNRFGQLGSPPHSQPVCTPSLLDHEMFRRVAATHVAASAVHSALYRADILVLFGLNQGQFGLPRDEDRATENIIEPRVVPCIPGGQALVLVACTPHATAVLTSAGDVLLLSQFRIQRVHFPVHTAVPWAPDDADPHGWHTLRITTSQRIAHVALHSVPTGTVGTAVAAQHGHVYLWRRGARSAPVKVVWSPVLTHAFVPARAVICTQDCLALLTVRGDVYVHSLPLRHLAWRALSVGRVDRLLANGAGTFAIVQHGMCPVASRAKIHVPFKQGKRGAQSITALPSPHACTLSEATLNMNSAEDGSYLHFKGSQSTYTVPWSLFQAYPWFRIMRSWHPSSPIDVTLFTDASLNLLFAVLQGEHPALSFRKCVSLLQLADYFLLEDVKHYLALRLASMVQLPLLTDALYLAYYYQLPALLAHCESIIMLDPEGSFPYLLAVYHHTPFPALLQKHLFRSIFPTTPDLPPIPPKMYIPFSCSQSTHVSLPSDTHALSKPGKRGTLRAAGPQMTPPSPQAYSPRISLGSEPYEKARRNKTINVITMTPDLIPFPSSSSASSLNAMPLTPSPSIEPVPAMPSSATWAEKHSLDCSHKKAVKELIWIGIESKFELSLLQEHKAKREFSSGEWMTFVKEPFGSEE